MKKMAIVAALAALFTGQASANHYYETADPQVVGTFNEMIQVLGQGCNFGNSAACNAIVLLQQEAHWMLSAGYDCRATNNPHACQFYQYKYGQLGQAYQEFNLARQSNHLMLNTGGGVGMGSTHEQRMQQIHDFGQQNTANFNARSAASDANHAAFIDMIRQ